MNWSGSQRPRTLAAFSALTVTMAALAVWHDGTKIAEVDLNDGGVWVTNLGLEGGYAVAAHLNYPSRTLDSYTEPGSTRFDLSQQANAVVVHDATTTNVAAIDTKTWQTGSPARLPKGAAASQGDEIVAVTDPGQGKVWVVPAESTDTFNPELAPAASGLKGARTVVGVDDVVHVVLPDGRLRDLTMNDGEWETSDVGEVPAFGEADELTVTAVGSTPVVVDHTAGWVAWPDHRQDLTDAGDVEVQAPGPESDDVVLAAPSDLLTVPLGGGDIGRHEVAANGSPVRPVVVGSCAYAAWSRTGQYVRDCESDDDVDKVYAALTKTSDSLVFRTNRDVVVLNDAENGDIFLVNEDMFLVNDWKTIRAEIDQEDEKKSEETKMKVFRRTKENHKPDPEDDILGVRAGTSVTLPVLANDADPDGDVLTASVSDYTTKLGEVRPVRDGRALRITVPQDAEGGDTFQYEASDGRKNGTGTASVNLSVSTGNAAPKQISGRESKLTMVERGQSEHRILQEYVDPDGDPFWVSDVKYPKGMNGIYRPDGLLKVNDEGTRSPGHREVVVTLTDGDATTDAMLDVTVKPRVPLPPVANADFVTVSEGKQVTVSPLKNDTDPNGGELFLSEIGKSSLGQAEGNLGSGKFSYVGDSPGTDYLEYSVSDGPHTKSGVVRIDVMPDEGSEELPVPDDDIALLPVGGEVVLDVLTNDTDPLGGVLVLESVGQDQSVGVVAEVIDHDMIRIRDNGLAAATTTLRYRVGNANGFASGLVTVVKDQRGASGAPLAVDDTATVRSGDVVTVDVLANDISPTGKPLTVEPDLSVTRGADLGTAFVSEDKVRFKAEASDGAARIKYTVADPDGNAHTGSLDLTILPASGANSAPAPEPMTARLLQGGSTEIQVAARPDGPRRGLRDPPGAGRPAQARRRDGRVRDDHLHLVSRDRTDRHGLLHLPGRGQVRRPGHRCGRDRHRPPR